jgi:hypothetical protein
MLNPTLHRQSSELKLVSVAIDSGSKCSAEHGVPALPVSRIVYARLCVSQLSFDSMFDLITGKSLC